METIDVLFAVTAFGQGGTERYVEDLAVALRQRDIRGAVAVDSEQILRRPCLHAAGIPVHILGIQSRCARAQAVRIYCGRPDSPYRADPVTSGTAPQIVLVGSMIPRKRPFLAIDAFRSLLGQYPDCTLVMAGDGELSSRVRSEAAGLKGR